MRTRISVLLAALAILAGAACGPPPLKPSPPIALPWIDSTTITPICVKPDGTMRWETWARYAGIYSFVIIVAPGIELVAEGNPPAPANSILRVETKTTPWYMVVRNPKTNAWVRASNNVTRRPTQAC